MIKWLWTSLSLLLLFCGFRSHPDNTGRINDWEDVWLVEPAQAEAMINYFNCTSPKCKKTRRFNYDNNIVRQISEKYKPINWQWIPARYRDEDEERYRQARKIPNGNQKGSVSGYETKLLKVVYEAGAGLEEESRMMYFDIGSICPPPDDCN